jgi:hypothetical protein
MMSNGKTSIKAMAHNLEQSICKPVSAFDASCSIQQYSKDLDESEASSEEKAVDVTMRTIELDSLGIFSLSPSKQIAAQLASSSTQQSPRSST